MRPISPRSVLFIKDAWQKACEYDGIDPHSMFVIFSADNPFVEAYNKMIEEMTRYVKGKKGEDNGGETHGIA